MDAMLYFLYIKKIRCNFSTKRSIKHISSLAVAIPTSSVANLFYQILLYICKKVPQQLTKVSFKKNAVKYSNHIAFKQNQDYLGCISCPCPFPSLVLQQETVPTKLLLRQRSGTEQLELAHPITKANIQYIHTEKKEFGCKSTRQLDFNIDFSLQNLSCFIKVFHEDYNYTNF